MTRVAILGNAGGGKTVLAAHLSSTLGLPGCSIDDVQWLPKWTPAPLELLRRRHQERLMTGRWVIDGWGVTVRLFQLMWRIHSSVRRDLLVLLATGRYRGRVVVTRSLDELGSFMVRVESLATA